MPTGDGANGGRLLDQLRSHRYVRLGIASEQPYSYIGKNGELTGSDPAIARVIFQRLGVPHVQPMPTEFNSLIAGLNSQQFDVVAAGMYIIPSRCEQVLFADPHYEMRDAFIVPKGNPKNIDAYEDIADKGAEMSTGTSYAQVDHAEEAGVSRSRITLLQDQLAGLLAVEQGRTDAFAGTAVTVRNVVRRSGSSRAEYTKEITPYLNGRPNPGTGAFAFRRGETRLCDAFNAELHKMKKSGELLRIMRPFGFLPREMTDRTAKERCNP